MRGPMSLRLTGAAALAAALLAGCQTATQQAARQQAQAAERYARVDLPGQRAATGAMTSTPAFRRLDGRWLGHEASTGAALPPQADLPPVFEQNFVFASAATLPLAEVVRRLSAETGVPVRVMPDVSDVAQGARPETLNNVVLWESGTLRRILDGLGAQTGLEWHFTSGEIQLSRLATASWRLDYPLRPVNASTSIGGGGGGGGGGSGAGSGGGGSITGSLSATLDTSQRLDPTSALIERLRTVLTPNGRLSISPVSNTVTVRDVRAAVEAAGRVIREENSLLSRTIEVEIEFVSIAARDVSEYGLDWNAVYRQIEDGVTRWTAGLAGPGSLVSATGGSLQFAVPTDSGTRTAGTSVVVRALSEMGETATVFRRSVVTGHNQPAPINVVQSQGYLARLTPAPTGGSGLGAGTPGAEQATITTGFQLTVTPTMLSGNRIQVTLALSLSSLDKLEDVSLGGGARIQTPTTSALQFIQAPVMNSGEIYAVQVFERTRNEGIGRTLDRTGVFGTQAGRHAREIVVMIVRPVLLSSAAPVT